MSRELDSLDFKSQKAARAVSQLSRPKPASDLAARTLARIANSAPVRKTIWILRPITNPFARCAAAAALALAVFPFGDMEVAAKIGSRIEDRVIGPHVVDGVEHLVDGLLPKNTDGYSQSELAAYFNVCEPNKISVKKLPKNKFIKPHMRMGV